MLALTSRRHTRIYTEKKISPGTTVQKLEERTNDVDIKGQVNRARTDARSYFRDDLVDAIVVEILCTDHLETDRAIVRDVLYALHSDRQRWALLRVCGQNLQPFCIVYPRVYWYWTSDSLPRRLRKRTRG